MPVSCAASLPPPAAAAATAAAAAAPAAEGSIATARVAVMEMRASPRRMPVSSVVCDV